MKKGRVIFDSARPGAWNMALDESLFLNVQNDEVVLRFYQFDPPTLSLGVFQSYEKTVNKEICEKYGIDIVRRPTGGRAVMHFKESTYSVVAKKIDLDSLKLKGFIYECVAESWLYTLKNIGLDEVDIEKAKKGEYFNRPSCFSITSFGEVNWRGRKMVGAAQLAEAQKVLQHGFLLLNIVPEYANNSVLGGINISREAIGVFDILGEQFDLIDQIKHYFIKKLQELLNITFEVSFFTEKEWANAELLHNLKYTNHSWTVQKNLDNNGIVYKILANEFAPVAQQDRAQDS